MKITMLFLIVVSLFQNAHADELSYFDRETITKNKIQKIREIITRYEKGKEPDDYQGSCVVWVYEFDKFGNIIVDGLARLGTEYGYVYNKKGDLIDWTWKDGGTGRVTYFSNELKQYPEEFNNGIEERRTRLNQILANKLDYQQEYERAISDICASIDAIYNIKLINQKNGLPVLLQAIKKRELRTFTNSKDFKSPQVLYIYYEYSHYH